MSDRVTNVEIEDVLSSIRRLVSIEDRRTDKYDPDHRTPTKSGADPRASQVDQKVDDQTNEDRLILSSNFRVNAPEGSARAGMASQVSVSSDASIPNPMLPSPQVKSSGPAQTGLSDRPEVGLSEVPTQSEPLGLEKWQVEAPAPPPASSASTETKAPQTNSAAISGNIEERLAWARKKRAQVLAKSIGGPADSASPLQEGGVQTKTFEGVSPGSKQLEARIAEVEAAVAARDDQWEPDGSEPDAGLPPEITALPWLRPRDATQAEPPNSVKPQEPMQSVDTSSVNRPPAVSPKPDNKTDIEAEAPWYGEDAVLDEAALRDLVSEIVRQELQGSLGERITRNVRKLVRREIHRAMMGQDFD